MADITLPQLGETVTEGTITRWFKKVGDAVAADEPLFEVSTDKVDTEVPSPVAGTLTEIRVNEGETVSVGTVIAVVGAANSAPTSQPAPVVAPAPVAQVAPAPQPAPAPAPAPVAQVAPAPAPAVQTQPIRAAQPVASVATATRAPISATASNKLLSPVVRRLVSDHGIDVNSLVGTGPGSRITREDVLDYIDKNGSAPQNVAPVVAPAPAPVVVTPVATAPVASPAPVVEAPKVAAPAPQPAQHSAPPAPKLTQGSERETVIPLTKISKLTAAHMIMSQAVSAHAFSVVEVDYANVDATRSEVKDQWKQSEGFTLTYLPFIARAIVDALAEYPNLNASIEADKLVVHNYVDLGIAVDLEFQGLLVPVVRSADDKRLRAIAREI